MTIKGRSEELVSRCVECDLAEPESLASLGGSAPEVVDVILSLMYVALGPMTVNTSDSKFSRGSGKNPQTTIGSSIYQSAMFSL